MRRDDPTGLRVVTCSLYSYPKGSDGRYCVTDPEDLGEILVPLPCTRRQLRETLLNVYGYTTDDYQRVLLTPFVIVDHDDCVIPESTGAVYCFGVKRQKMC